MNQSLNCSVRTVISRDDDCLPLNINAEGNETLVAFYNPAPRQKDLSIFVESFTHVLEQLKHAADISASNGGLTDSNSSEKSTGSTHIFVEEQDNDVMNIEKLPLHALRRYAVAATQSIKDFIEFAASVPSEVCTPPLPEAYTSATSRSGFMASTGNRGFAQMPLNLSNQIKRGGTLRRFFMNSFSADTNGEAGLNHSRADSTVLTNHLMKNEQDGFKLVNQYMILQELGRGQYGKVKLAADTKRDDKLVAIKVIPRSKVRNQFIAHSDEKKPGSSSSLSKAMLREVAIMKKLKHPNIVRLLEVIDDSEAAKLYLVMQCVSRGPLLNLDSHGRCEPIEMGAARRYVKQLCGALHYLQQKKIAHRDIKPENILLGDNGCVYLSDFGVSDWLNDADPDGTVAGAQGTLAFMAPEVVRGDAKHDGHAADIWSLGVTFYAMVYGRLPFYGEARSQITSAILEFEPTYVPPTDSNKLSVSDDSAHSGEDELTDDDDGEDLNSATDGHMSPLMPLAPLAFADDTDLLEVNQLIEFEDLIRKMLVKDPTKRIDLRGIASHDFFKAGAQSSGGPSIQMPRSYSPPFSDPAKLSPAAPAALSPNSVSRSPRARKHTFVFSPDDALDGSCSGGSFAFSGSAEDGSPKLSTIQRLSLVRPHLAD